LTLCLNLDSLDLRIFLIGGKADNVGLGIYYLQRIFLKYAI